MAAIRRKTPRGQVTKNAKRTTRKCPEPEPSGAIPGPPAPEGVPPARYLAEPNLELRRVLHWVCLDAMRTPATEQAKFIGWVQQLLAPRLAALARSPTNTLRGRTNTRALMRFVAHLAKIAARVERNQLEFRARVAEAWVQQVIAQIEWAPRETEGGLSTDQMTGVVSAMKAILEQDGLLRLPGREEAD